MLSPTSLAPFILPVLDALKETRSSLEFGKRAKLVRNCAEINLEASCALHEYAVHGASCQVSQYVDHFRCAGRVKRDAPNLSYTWHGLCLHASVLEQMGRLRQLGPSASEPAS